MIATFLYIIFEHSASIHEILTKLNPQFVYGIDKSIIYGRKDQTDVLLSTLNQ